MFWNIFKYELKYWIKQPTTYIFGATFFVFGFATMAITGDILGEKTALEGSIFFANSSYRLISYFYDINIFILFVIPIFIGGAIFRDYSSNAFMVLYSFPIKKLDYFLGKFLSGLFITSSILLLVGIGLFFGSLLPGLNPLIIGSNSLLNYFLPYFLVVLPNLLFISMLIFSVVLLSRNSYAGFTTILLLYVLRRILLFVLGGPDNQFLVALFDPFGQTAIFDSIKNWSFDEVNSLTVPVSKTLTFNRLIWINISSIIFIIAYQKFSLSQNLTSFGFFKRNIEKAPSEKKKNILSQRTTITPIVSHYSFTTQLFTTWNISKCEFKSIVFSKSFLALLIGSLIFMLLLLGQVNPQYTSRIQPLTQVMMLIPALFYSFVVMMITFLYAGILIHRDRRSRINQLVDVCSIPSWSLLGSKFLTLLKLQIILLSVIMIAGISIQAWKGYLHFEIPLYLFHIYGILFITLAIWAIMALFVQTLVPNQYLGFFLLLMFALGLSGLDSVGIKLDIFKFNSAPLLEHSDLSGFGGILPSYYIHKFYWFLFGCLLLIGTYLFWERGISKTLKDRVQQASQRISKQVVTAVFLLVIGFVGTGFLIYSNVYPTKPTFTSEEFDVYKVNAEKKYSKFKNIAQPRLSKVKMRMNLFPKERNYTSSGELFFVNKSNTPIDTLLVNYADGKIISLEFDQNVDLIHEDSILKFNSYTLAESLVSGDTLSLSFKASNLSSTLFRTNSQVTSNGTFLLADFPLLGYPNFALSNTAKRNSYGLPPQKETNLNPTDSLAKQHSYVGKHIDLFEFEAIVSTSSDQIALAPGKLINKWKEEKRSYFHYKSEANIRNGIVFNSGQFDVLKDSLNGVSLEIYHHKTHGFNLDRMMRAMKSTLEYSTKNFGEYPFNQLRIVEFPNQYGRFAQSFANTIPFSEFAGFISKEDESENRFDDVLRLTAHEMAHQWWGHQIVPAEALGNRMLTESLAEFTALKVLKQEYGSEKKHLYLGLIRKNYLEQRRRAQTESPLSLAEPNEAYIHYAKGLLVFNSLNEYLGNELFSSTLKSFFQKFKTTEAPYPTSLDLVDEFRKVIPDSLRYLITDLFETVTLYETSINKASFHAIKDGSYEVTVDLSYSKFRNSETNINLPINDWLEIGIYGENGKLIHSNTYSVSSGENVITIHLKQKPSTIVLDPFTLLIEENSTNNIFEF